MKPKSTLCSFLAVAGSSLLAISSARAATFTWTQAAGGAQDWAAAEKVMKKHGIPINDLHGTITSWDGYAQWKKGNDVHFSGAVYAMLASKVADAITKELADAGENPKPTTQQGAKL